MTISKDVSKIELLKTYKEWVSCNLNVKETNHIIETYIPKEEGDINEATKKTTTEAKPEKSIK